MWPHDAQSAARIGKDKVVAFLHQCQIGRVDKNQDLRDYRFVQLEKGRLYLVAIIPSGGTIGDIIALVNCDLGSCISHWISYGIEKDLQKDIVSLSGDGAYQIVSGQLLRGVVPYIYVPYIYEIGENRTLCDASRKYQKWYTRHLYPELLRQYRFARADPPGALVPRSRAQIASDTAEAQAALDDYRQRVLGLRPPRPAAAAKH